MTVVLREKDGGYAVLTKGALDRLPLRKLSWEEETQAKVVHDSFAEKALRVIAIAYKRVDALPDREHLEKSAPIWKPVNSHPLYLLEVQNPYHIRFYP